MKVLLLGANGILGSYLKTSLGNSAYECVALEKEDCDISSSEECKEVIQKRVRPDVVINAAAFTNVDLCETEQAEAYRVNAEGPRNLAVFCNAIKARLIHFSTDYVFDGEKSVPYLETDEPNPINIYGKSKLKGDQFIQDISDDFLIVRIAGLFGRNGISFVHKILAKLAANENITVVDDQVISPTYAKDLAEEVIKLLDKKTPPIMNITNKGCCSWWEFTREIVKIHQKEQQVQVSPIKTDLLNLPASRPSFAVLSGELFQETTGNTLRNWPDALKAFILNEQPSL